MKLNDYYQKKLAEAMAWEEKSYDIKKRLEEALKAKPEEDNFAKVDAIYKEKEEHTKAYPFTRGAGKAFRAIYHNKGEELVMDDYNWMGDHLGFVNFLRDCGIDTFLVTNQSTGLMEDIHEYTNAGCVMVGPEIVTEEGEFFGRTFPEKKLALRFVIK